MKKSKVRLLQKQNDRQIHFKQGVITYVGLEYRLKALEEKANNKSS